MLALPNAALLPGVNTFGDRSVDISLQSALLGMDEGKGTDGSARAAAAALGPAGQRLLAAQVDALRNGAVPHPHHPWRRARRQAPGRAAHLVERDIAERLDADLAHAQLTGTSLSLVVADIDNFKQINDRFGHAVGDQLLTEVAQVFARSLRELDLAGRYGGEEFVAILPGARLANARRTAERVRRAIEEIEVTTPRGPIGRVSASFGVAEFPTLHDRAGALRGGRQRAVRGEGRRQEPRRERDPRQARAGDRSRHDSDRRRVSGPQTVIRIATSYLSTDVRLPGVSPVGMALRVASP